MPTNAERAERSLYDWALLDVKAAADRGAEIARGDAPDPFADDAHGANGQRDARIARLGAMAWLGAAASSAHGELTAESFATWVAEYLDPWSDRADDLWNMRRAALDNGGNRAPGESPKFAWTHGDPDAHGTPDTVGGKPVTSLNVESFVGDLVAAWEKFKNSAELADCQHLLAFYPD